MYPRLREPSGASRDSRRQQALQLGQVHPRGHVQAERCYRYFPIDANRIHIRVRFQPFQVRDDLVTHTPRLIQTGPSWTNGDVILGSREPGHLPAGFGRRLRWHVDLDRDDLVTHPPGLIQTGPSWTNGDVILGSREPGHLPAGFGRRLRWHVDLED